MVPWIAFCFLLALPASQVAGQKITYSITQVERGEAAWITLRWSGIKCPAGQSCSHPSADVSDRIALVYGGQTQPSKPKHTIKHLFVHQAAPQSFAKGAGAATFWVPNQRFEIRAVYIRRDMSPGGDSATRSIWKNTDELASIVIPAWKPNYPALGRLSILDDAYRRVAVTWHTRDALPDSKVQWGTKSTALTNTAAAAFDTSYSSSAMCGAPANYEGWGAGTDTINTAVISNLAPSTTYFYKYGSKAAGFSTVLNFTTPPATAADAPVNILLVADSGHWSPDGAYETSGISYKMQEQIPHWAGVPGIGSIAFTAANALLKAGGDAPNQPASRLVYKALTAELNKKGKQYHAALFAGDLAYAEGESAQWQAFLWGVQGIVQRMPAMYIPGNHEVDAPTGLSDAASYALGDDSGGECGQAYRSLLRMPTPTGSGNDFYSYNIGPVHFVMLSSERNVSMGSAQYEWMKQDLQDVDRAVTHWVIVSVHRPLYSDSSSKEAAKVAELMRQEMEPLLAEMQVDFVFSGHLHDYKRSCPVLKGTCVGYEQAGPRSAKGPVHVVFGNGGYQQELTQYPQQPSWAEKSFSGYGFSTMSATKTQIIIQSYDTSGAVTDSLTLNKPAGWTPNRVAAAAAYTGTPATPSPPSDFNLYAVAFAYAPGFLMYLASNSNNPQLNAVLGPGSEVYNLTNARPGSELATHDMVSGSLPVQLIWDAHQIWVVTRAVAMFLQPLTTQQYFQPLANDVNLLLNMTAPGGRLYFGP